MAPPSLDVDRHAGWGRGAAPLRPHKAGGVAVIHHHQRLVPVGQGADLGQLRQVAIHAEHAVGGDHDMPRAGGAGGLQLGLQIRHVGIGIAVSFRLAEPDPVDDRGMVQRVRDHRVLGPQKRFENAAIGIETGGKQDRVVQAEKLCQPLFQRAVQVLGAADEAHAGHAEPVIVHRPFGRGDQRGMIGKAEIVVGAEVDHAAPVHGDFAALWRGDQPFALGQPLGVDFGKRV